MTAVSTPSLGAQIRARRINLGMSQEAAARAAQVSRATWQRLELDRDDRPNGITQARVCEALGWTDDSLRRIQRGQEPLEAGDTIEQRVARIERLLAALQRDRDRDGP